MYDANLTPLLRQCSNEQLAPIVELLEGTFTNQLSDHIEYLRHAPDHREYVDAIVDEFQKFGGNTFVNLFRGGGVSYREILGDVCKRMKVRRQAGDSLEDLEMHLLEKVTADALEQMSSAERRELDESLLRFFTLTVAIA